MSEFLNYLGNIEEKFKQNHSSELLFNSVDYCLMEATKSVIDSTYLIEELLILISKSPSRKILYNLDKKVFDDWTFKFFIMPTTSKKLKIFRQIKTNRDLVCFIIETYIAQIEPIIQQLECGETILIKAKIKNKSIFHHSINLEKCKFWYNTYLDMRESICQKYYRHIRNNVTKAHFSTHGRVDDDDMAMEFFINLIRAFSRYDVASGTFTSFVNNWFKFAKSKSIETDEVGNAFVIPTSIRTAIAKGESNVVNFSTEIDQNFDYTSSTLEEDYIDETTYKIMEMFDNNNFYRLVNKYQTSTNILECCNPEYKF